MKPQDWLGIGLILGYALAVVAGSTIGVLLWVASHLEKWLG